jgi:RimJ/RimL family protein N-acetyltransferase
VGTTYPAGVPVLTDGVVTLRAHRDQDAERIIEQSIDPDSVAWTTVPSPYGPQEVADFLARVRADNAQPGGQRWWAVSDDQGGYLGTIDLRPAPGRRAEVGFGLHPGARGRGVMSRALRLACSWAFDHGVEVVHWSARVGNWPSLRVAWACGFTVHATVPDLLGDARGRYDGWVATLRAGQAMTPRSRWLTPPVLDTDRTRLREWRSDDAEWISDPDEASRRFMPSGAAPFAADYSSWVQTRELRMAMGEGIYWCLADGAGDRPIGHVQVFRLDQPSSAGSGQLGYWLFPQARGEGLMTEALLAAVRHSFVPVEVGGLGLHRLGADTEAGNEASNRVLRGLGFRQVGVQRGVVAHPGEAPADLIVWELDRDRPTAAAPVVEGSRCRLRPWRREDVARVVEACADEVTQHWLGALPRPYEAAHADRFIVDAVASTARGSSVHWCIADPVTDEAIGAVTLMDLDGHSTEVGYWVHPASRGLGVMREAAWLATRHAVLPHDVGGLGLQVVRLRAAADNSASRRVAEAVGFRLAGLERRAVHLGDGTTTDRARYDLLPEDLAAAPD